MPNQTPATSSLAQDVRPGPDSSLTADDVLRAAEDLVPLLREGAAATDDSRRISGDTYRRLEDAGFLHILKPKKYEGLELTDHEHAMVTLTLARGCASTAWVFSVLSAGNIALLAFPEEVQDEVWGPDPYATLAGNINLNPKAKVERVQGGYRLSGQWGFCSGSDFSKWLMFNAPAGENGEGHMFLVDQKEAVVIDDWFPTGLRGTGSRSMAIEDVFVPDRRILPMREIRPLLEQRRALHPTFDSLWSSWPAAGRFPFAAVAVGAALGAADHFAETAASATRVASAVGGVAKLADQEYVATEFAEAAGELDMARTLVDQRSLEASRRAAAHQPPTPTELMRDTRDNALVTRIALRNVQRIASLVGAKSGNPAHPVSLAKRDVEMASHHVTLNWRRAAIDYMATAAQG
ncbi:acyl-CoA dehydrogenase family protein [Streptomyces justiciae]|uniref:acyl-CoA dehydrogenase family protein n=1 Tax=Streptomyces justiciae TaxID=2780140 RepID=UPI0018817958|nr:acyl-CoA dehydrogenase family protein [Streptomyces justiciae]MBE8477395.1 acyl-CoA dehydrogenase family protein [Streptomyces justiciae]